MNHPYFAVSEDRKFGVEPINEVVPVSILYDKKLSENLITIDTINLANFSNVKNKYKQQIDNLFEKDGEGRSGMRLLDKALMSLIDDNQSSFKSITLPKPE